MLADGTLDRLRAETASERVLLVELERAVPRLAGLPGVVSVDVAAGGLRQRLAFRPGETTAARLIAAVAGVAPVRDLSLLEPTIEDVIRALYRREREEDRQCAFW